MTTYRTMAGAATILALACWGIATGLALEKVQADGISSWSLLLAMPVLVAAIAWLVHIAVEDFREWRFFRSSIALTLAVVALSVTLPNSIGSAGSAKDAAVAKAEASNRGLVFSEKMLGAAEKDLSDAKQGVARECVGAPAKIVGNTWPKCQWWRRQVEAHTLAAKEYGKGLAEAPAEQKALSGETRIAWALGSAGLNITEADVQMAQPMTLPIAAELLCAFFGFMAFEFRKRAVDEEKTAKAARKEETDTQAQIVSETVVEPKAEEPFFVEETEPTPPKGSKKQTRREKRKETGLMKLRARTLAGERPKLRVIMSRHRVSKATASRWRKEAEALANAA